MVKLSFAFGLLLGLCTVEISAIPYSIQQENRELPAKNVNNVMTDANIYAAVAMWLSNKTAALTTYGDISSWDTSRVTGMFYLFADSNFNDDVSKWQTHSVTDMSGLFSQSTSFNRDLSKWDTSRVSNLSQMFSQAYSFNGDVSKWKTSRVTDMTAMFQLATSFNQDVSKWDTSQVVSMAAMFQETPRFNCDLSGWSTCMVTYMDGMFFRSTSFNQVLCWDVSKTTSYYGEVGSPSEMFNGSKGSWSTVPYPGCLPAKQKKGAKAGKC